MEKLLRAIEKGDYAKVKKLLDTSEKLDLNVAFSIKSEKYPDYWKHTSFSYACQFSSLKVLRYLRLKGAKAADLPADFEEGYSLAIAVLYSQFHVADWLQKTLSIDCSIGRSYPLRLSAEYGNLDGVKYALNHNADIHAEDEAALRYAFISDHLDTVKYLVAKGADMHVWDGRLLREAAQYGQIELASFLLSRGMSLQEYDSVLSLAVEENQRDMVEFLLSKGADLQTLDDGALKSAIFSGHFDLVGWLLDRGAKPTRKNFDSHTFQYLVEKDQYELAAKAIRLGADTSELSESGLQEILRRAVAPKMTKKGLL